MNKYDQLADTEYKSLRKYSKKALSALSKTLKLHQQLVWLNPETNELSIKHLPAGSISARQTNT
ncbi:MAG: hypothetical protein WAU07_04130 [Microgenomates group bacterium]